MSDIDSLWAAALAHEGNLRRAVAAKEKEILLAKNDLRRMRMSLTEASQARRQVELEMAARRISPFVRAQQEADDRASGRL